MHDDPHAEGSWLLAALAVAMVLWLLLASLARTAEGRPPQAPVPPQGPPVAAEPAPVEPVDPNPWRYDPVKGWWRPVLNHSLPAVTPRVQGAAVGHYGPETGTYAPAAFYHCPPGRG